MRETLRKIMTLGAFGLLATLGVVLLTATPAAADGDPSTYYVSVSGNDGSDGQSQATAFRTITHAMNRAQPGQTIYVMNGTYNEHVFITTSGTSNAYIRLTAAPGHSPVIERNTGNAVQVRGSYIEVSGFEVRGVGYSASNNSGYGMLADKTHHVSFQNNIVHGFATSGISTYQASHVSIAYNTVYENSLWGPEQGSGISIFQPVNMGFGDDGFSFSNYIVGNTVYANENRIPASYGNGTEVTDGNGIIVDSTKATGYTGRTFIANNTAFNNGGRGINVFNSEHVWVLQNTTYKNTWSSALRGTRSEIAAWDSNDVLLANNIVEPIAGSRGVAVSGNVTVGGNFVVGNPDSVAPNDVYSPTAGFVRGSTDPALIDFRLAQGSPAIGQGWPYAPGLHRPDPGAFPVGSPKSWS